MTMANAPQYAPLVYTVHTCDQVSELGAGYVSSERSGRTLAHLITNMLTIRIPPQATNVATLRLEEHPEPATLAPLR